MRPLVSPWLLIRFLVALCLGGLLPGEEPAPTGPVTIARFAGDRVAALSYTFDDGTLGHYRVAAPTLERHGFRGTFGVVAGNTADDPAAGDLAASKQKDPTKPRRVSWQEWRDLVARGHEVANHGLRHRGLPDLTPEQLEQEVNDSARLITAKLGLAPRSFIYPGNKRNPAMRDFVLKTHVATREKELRLGGPDFSLAGINARIDQVVTNREAAIVMAHAVAEDGYQTVSAEDLDHHLQYVATLADRLWVAPMGSVGCYARERDSATVTVTAQTTDSLTFRLECPLEPTRFAVPLTCVARPAGKVQAGSATGERAGAAVPVQSVGDALLVDVVPGPAPVTLRWTAVP